MLLQPVAEQIASLLNKYNRLQGRYDSRRIQNSSAVYLPLCYGNLVLGSVAVERKTFLLSEIKHLVVHPEARGYKLGIYLVQSAVVAATTPLLYATVRLDNAASLRLFRKKGFRLVSVIPFIDYWLGFLLRERDDFSVSK